MSNENQVKKFEAKIPRRTYQEVDDVFEFEQARHYNRSMQEAYAYAQQECGLVDGGEEIWIAITTPNLVTQGSFAEALKLTMPADLLPVVRAQSGVAAGYVFCCAIANLPKNTGDPQEVLAAARTVWKMVEERQTLSERLDDGFGCDLSPSWELARELSNIDDAGDRQRIEEIARMAGQMYQVLDCGPTTETNDPHEVKNVKTSGDIERLVESEVAQLFTEGLETAAAVKIIEEKALAYQLKGKQQLSRGPLVIMVDESGSMNDDGVGKRNSWAKAACVALTRVAHDGGRHVVVVHYSTTSVPRDLVPGDHFQMLEMAKHFMDGGTYIAGALERGLAQVGELEKKGLIGADLILITDGEDGDHARQEPHLLEAAKRGVRLWTVAIECRPDPKSPIVKYAEKVIRVGATKRADDVADLRDAAINTVSASDFARAQQRARELDGQLN